MAPPDPKNPFDSTRLSFRAVRPVEDLALFTEISDDQTGFANSNRANIGLPGPADVESWVKAMINENLLGAVIWLKPEYAREHATGKNGDGGDAKEGVFTSKWGTAIGEIHLTASSPGTAHHRSTELGIDILPNYQGRAYGAETIVWALDFAFRRAGLHRVRVRAFEWNEGAVRLYEKLGFTVEGREREGYWHEGRWWDCVELSMLEGEWREKEKEIEAMVERTIEGKLKAKEKGKEE